MEIVKLQGFPKEVSEYIEAPDIAELLMYPMFKVAEADTVRKYGTDFQKMLLDRAPLRNKRKHVTVYSSVHILDHTKRAITSHNVERSKGEWHIDGSQDNEFDYLNPDQYETIHLYQSHSPLLTVFNTAELEIPVAGRMPRTIFSTYINMKYKDKLVLQESELNKIYTFDTHLHRPAPTTRIEFRYLFRIRETDRTDVPSVENQIRKENTSNSIYDLTRDVGIVRDNGTVTIFFPQTLRGKLYDFQD